MQANKCCSPAKSGQPHVLGLLLSSGYTGLTGEPLQYPSWDFPPPQEVLHVVVGAVDKLGVACHVGWLDLVCP